MPVLLFSLLSFLVALLIQAGLFYMATRITGNQTPFKTLFLIALIGAVCSAVPVVGFLLGLIVVLFLLVQWGKMSWLAAILTVLLAYVLAFAIVLGLGILLGLGAALTTSGSSGAAAAAILFL